MKYLIILVCSCILFACSAPTDSTDKNTKTTSQETIRQEEPYDFGTVEVSNLNEKVDYTAFQNFIKDKETKAPCSVKITNYTIEGDPIYSTVTYKDGIYTLVYDTSKDKFGSQEIYTREFSYLYSIKGTDMMEHYDKENNVKIEWTPEVPNLTFWILSTEDGKYPEYGKTGDPSPLPDPFNLLHVPNS